MGVAGCDGPERAVATVNGEKIPRSVVQLDDLEKDKLQRAEQSRGADSLTWRETYVGLRQGNKLRRRIFEMLESQALNAIAVEVSTEEIEAEFQRLKATYESFSGSIDRFVEIERAKREAWGRMRDDPAEAEAIYTEILEPLGIRHVEVERSRELYLSVDTDPDAFARDAADFLDKLKTTAATEVTLRKKRETLFNMGPEPTEDEIDVKIASFRFDADVPMDTRYTIARGALLADRLVSARGQWLRETLETAKIEIHDPNLAEIDLLKGL